MIGGSSRVADVYTNRSIFVTGASGFLGKVMLEKLLFSTNVKAIYVLIRPLKGHTAKERLDGILKSPLFDRIRETNSNAFQKLKPVTGDLMHESLGLSQEDQEKIFENVSIVFHCAATVRFDEAIRVSVKMNLVGTQMVIALCHKIKNLVSIVHASTAYANCNLSSTEEKVYEPSVHPQKLVQAIEWMNDDMLKTITPALLDNRPNTYTLTKALAESHLLEDAKDLPIIMIRPSIIGAVWREPLPGWTDNFNGPTGILAAVGKGVLTNMCGSVVSKADIIPVDIVSNMMIVAGAHRATTEYAKIPVMHCSSGALNPIKWYRLVVFVQRMYHQYPLDECYRVPATHFHSSRRLFLFNFYYKHYIPAVLLDLFNRGIGKKTKYVQMYVKIWKMIETLHFFTTRGWNFESSNLVTLWNTLSPEDQKEFNFDVRQINWDEYLFDYVMGIKVYLLKESLDALPKAQANLARLKQVSLYWNAGFWALLVRFFFWKRTRTQKWAMWLIGFASTYIFQNGYFRPNVHLKSLEDYKVSAALVKSF